MPEFQDQPPEPRDRDQPGQPGQPDPDERREPDMSDPEAQHAPGDGSTTGVPGESPPPMRARSDDRIEMDAAGAGYEAVGNDTIREGRVGGVMGAPHAGRGQGQGG